MEWILTVPRRNQPTQYLDIGLLDSPVFSLCDAPDTPGQEARAERPSSVTRSGPSPCPDAPVTWRHDASPRAPARLQKEEAPTSQVAQLVKNPPALQETRVRFLGLEDSPDFRQERAGGEGGDRGPDGWMASPTQWT